MATSRTQPLDELPLEQQPKYTEQDEQRELAALTTQELLELQSDLTGIHALTNGFSGLGLGGVGCVSSLGGGPVVLGLCLGPGALFRFGLLSCRCAPFPLSSCCAQGRVGSPVLVSSVWWFLSMLVCRCPYCAGQVVLIIYMGRHDLVCSVLLCPSLFCSLWSALVCSSLLCSRQAYCR